MKTSLAYLLCLALTACQSAAAEAPPPSAHAGATPSGQMFAAAACGGCHAIGRSGYSSNSNAPRFVDIINREGLTRETLSTWLRGAHNYPSEMDFYLSDGQVDALVAYMLTLRDPNYRPSPD